jgi:hypothetical protein
MELFNNKENDSLKFKINSEGIDVNKVEPRLVLITKENKNYLFLGEIHNDVCKFNIPRLELLNTGDEGKIKFEIISEDMYFSVWEDNFHIKTKANIKIEEMISQINKEEEKKKITIDAVFEGTEKKEQIVKEEQHIKHTRPSRKKEEPENTGIIDFNTFFKKH